MISMWRLNIDFGWTVIVIHVIVSDCLSLVNFRVSKEVEMSVRDASLRWFFQLTTSAALNCVDMFPAYRQLVIGQAKYVNFELYCLTKPYFSLIVVRHVCLLYLVGCRQS